MNRVCDKIRYKFMILWDYHYQNSPQYISNNCKMKDIAIKVRRARKNDCQEIMRLTQELAEFEKMPHSVQLDAQTLERDGFETNNPSFHCLVTDDPESNNEETSKLIAYALYNFIYGTWEGKRLWLENIIVTEKYRGKGIGETLFSAVCKEAVKENAKAVRFVVLKWNPAIKFYKKFGMTNLTEIEEWQFSTLKYNQVIKTANLFKETIN